MQNFDFITFSIIKRKYVRSVNAMCKLTHVKSRKNVIQMFRYTCMLAITMCDWFYYNLSDFSVKIEFLQHTEEYYTVWTLQCVFVKKKINNFLLPFRTRRVHFTSVWIITKTHFVCIILYVTRLFTRGSKLDVIVLNELKYRWT